MKRYLLVLIVGLIASHLAYAQDKKGEIVLDLDDDSVFSILDMKGQEVLRFRQVVTSCYLTKQLGLSLAAQHQYDSTLRGLVDTYRNDDLIVEVVNDEKVSPDALWISRIEILSSSYSAGKKIAIGIRRLYFGEFPPDIGRFLLIGKTTDFMWTDEYSIRGRRLFDPYDSVVELITDNWRLVRIVIRLGEERYGD